MGRLEIPRGGTAKGYPPRDGRYVSLPQMSTELASHLTGVVRGTREQLSGEDAKYQADALSMVTKGHRHDVVESIDLVPGVDAEVNPTTDQPQS